MSRSYRKTPFLGNAGDKGESQYKQAHSQKERARVRALLAHRLYDRLVGQLVRFNEYDTDRDGRKYLPEWFPGRTRIYPFENQQHNILWSEPDPSLAKKRLSK